MRIAVKVLDQVLGFTSALQVFANAFGQTLASNASNRLRIDAILK